MGGVGPTVSETEGQEPAEQAGSTPDADPPGQSETGVGMGAGEPNSFEPEEADPADDDPADDPPS